MIAKRAMAAVHATIIPALGSNRSNKTTGRNPPIGLDPNKGAISGYFFVVKIGIRFFVYQYNSHRPVWLSSDSTRCIIKTIEG